MCHTDRTLPAILERYIFLYLVWQHNVEKYEDSGRAGASIKFGANGGEESSA